MIIDIEELKEIAEVEFNDIVKHVQIMDINELRIFLIDGSFIDIWYSLKLQNRYSYHWDRRHIDGSIYRHDNAPHQKWSYVSTFPKHFHNKKEETVEESYISDEPSKALREFLSFARKVLATNLEE